MERERIYKPTGTGLCKTCGHDVGAHDGGHEPRIHFGPFDGPLDAMYCVECGKHAGHVVHDVGRVLRCPGE